MFDTNQLKVGVVNMKSTWVSLFWLLLPASAADLRLTPRTCLEIHGMKLMKPPENAGLLFFKKKNTEKPQNLFFTFKNSQTKKQNEKK